jgi:hypothetical protein
MYLTRLKSDDYTCRTVRKWLVDAGSIPASSTICILRETLSHYLRIPQRPCLCGVSPFLGVVFVLKRGPEKHRFGRFLLSILQNLWT